PPAAALYAYTTLFRSDPARPDAWKAPRLLADMKRWAGQLLAQRRHVVVFVSDDATLVMPDQTVPMGRMRPGEGFLVKTTYRNGKDRKSTRLNSSHVKS